MKTITVTIKTYDNSTVEDVERAVTAGLDSNGIDYIYDVEEAKDVTSIRKEGIEIMKYSIKVSETQGGSENLKGIVNLTLADSFKLTGIKIYNNPEKNTLFVAMPNFKSAQQNENGETVYKDIFNPITAEFRNDLYGNILDAYKELHENQARNSYSVEVNEKISTMPEFSVHVTPFEKEGSDIRGLCSVTFENSLIVNNISIYEGKSGNLFVKMPNYKSSQLDEQGKPVYKDIVYPVTAKFREKLYDKILDTYTQAKEHQQQEQRGSVVGKLEMNKTAVTEADNQSVNRTHEQPLRSDAR